MCTIKQARYIVGTIGEALLERLRKGIFFTFLFSGHLGYSLQTNAQS